MDVHFLLEKSRLKLYLFESFFVIFSRTIDNTCTFLPVTMKVFLGKTDILNIKTRKIRQKVHQIE